MDKKYEMRDSRRDRSVCDFCYKSFSEKDLIDIKDNQLICKKCFENSESLMVEFLVRQLNEKTK